MSASTHMYMYVWCAVFCHGDFVVEKAPTYGHVKHSSYNILPVLVMVSFGLVTFLMYMYVCTWNNHVHA